MWLRWLHTMLDSPSDFYRYYPALMLGAGVTTYIWDSQCLQKASHASIEFLQKRLSLMRPAHHDVELACKTFSGIGSSQSCNTEKPLPELPKAHYRTSGICQEATMDTTLARPQSMTLPKSKNGRVDTSEIPSISWQLGAGLLVAFGLTLILFMALHIALTGLERTFSLFSSLYLAGTIIFGGTSFRLAAKISLTIFLQRVPGGPVVIPLLREYIVSPGWVSPRNFLLGLAVIQAFPGPNFNFVVYLGSLATFGTSYPSYVGALIAFVAMYTPGLFILVGFMGLWRIISQKRWFISTLRGINAAAVGLVFTAVYKLWQMGCLSATVQGGSPLGSDPWLVLITATAYVGGAWFGMNAPFAILLGGVLGITRYAALDT